ncbi:MAG: hypothetical protein AAGA96_18180 [Verrucomicrobiota bacterium]
MRILAEHRSISVITLIHMGFVIYGFLGTKAFINFREKIAWPTPGIADSFASFGLLLLLLPAVWLAVLTVLEKKAIDWTEGFVGIYVAIGIVGTAFFGAFLSVKAVAAASVF